MSIEATAPAPDDADKPLIRSAGVADAAAVAEIYNPYVLDSIVTFEEQAVTAADMAQRIEAVLGDNLPWLVAVNAGTIVGYAYATRWKPRYGYRFSVEITVYLAASVGGRGIGSRLYQALFAILRERGLRNAIGGIALPNPASVALHEKFGMRQVAQFNEIGIKYGRWIDVGYWQVTLPA